MNSNNRLVVEIGMKLDKNLVYYHELLTKLGAKLAFSCITHDYYYSKRHMEGLTENEMKNACIRLRDCQGLNRGLNSKKELLKKEKELMKGQAFKKKAVSLITKWLYNHKMTNCLARPVFLDHSFHNIDLMAKIVHLKVPMLVYTVTTQKDYDYIVNKVDNVIFENLELNKNGK